MTTAMWVVMGIGWAAFLVVVAWGLWSTRR